MSISPSDSSIFGSSFGHPAVAAAFSDQQSVEYMLRVEAALARVLGRQGLIPEPAAARVAQAASQVKVDLDRLRAETERAGFPVAELVRQLRAQAGDEAGEFVHWGATTQDILDTARVLQIQESLQPVELAMGKLITRLAELAERQRGQLMAGRTHTQQALPITFGYKVATWLAPLLRHRQRLAELKPRLLVLQLGGPVGTLAAYGEHGPTVYKAMAQELGLALAAAPWHSQRDGFAEFAGWLSLLTPAFQEWLPRIHERGMDEKNAELYGTAAIQESRLEPWPNPNPRVRFRSSCARTANTTSSRCAA